MWLRIGVGAVVSAAVMMLWSFLFWTVFEVPASVLLPLPGGERTAAWLQQNLPQSGVFLWPVPPRGEAAGRGESWSRFEQEQRHGPLIHLFYRDQGTLGLSFTMYARGLLQFFVAAAIAGWLLRQVTPQLKSYIRRVGFVVLLGVFAAVLVNLGRPIWFYHPWNYHLLLAGYDTFNALLMGIVLAAWVK